MKSKQILISLLCALSIPAAHAMDIEPTTHQEEAVHATSQAKDCTSLLEQDYEIRALELGDASAQPNHDLLKACK